MVGPLYTVTDTPLYRHSRVSYPLCHVEMHRFLLRIELTCLVLCVGWEYHDLHWAGTWNGITLSSSGRIGQDGSLSQGITLSVPNVDIAIVRRKYLLLITEAQGFYIANGSYIISTSLVKLALLIQYLRVPMLGRYMRLFVIGLAIFTTLWSVAYAVIAWVPCYPISDYWSLNPAANCWAFASQDPHTFLMTFETHTALNMVLDLVILFVPAVLYFQHDFGEKTRWRFLGLLFLGTL